MSSSRSSSSFFSAQTSPDAGEDIGMAFIDSPETASNTNELTPEIDSPVPSESACNSEELASQEKLIQGINQLNADIAHLISDISILTKLADHLRISKSHHSDFPCHLVLSEHSRGLTEIQAKLVTLQGNIATLPPGAEIPRTKGDPKLKDNLVTEYQIYEKLFWFHQKEFERARGKMEKLRLKLEDEYGGDDEDGFYGGEDPGYRVLKMEWVPRPGKPIREGLSGRT